MVRFIGYAFNIASNEVIIGGPMKIAMDLLKADHIGVRDFKSHFSKRLKSARPVVVTDHSQPVKVIMPYADMVELLDMLDEMTDEKTLTAIREGRGAIRSGVKGIPVSRLFDKKRAKK